MASISCKKVDFSTITPQEGHEIVTLLNIYASDPMGGGESLKEETKFHLIEELVKRQQICHVFILRVDDESAGLAISFEGFSTFHCKPLLNIHDFVVVPKYRGQGLAKQLLQAVVDFARSINCCKITLEVLEGNHTARSCYEKMGFHGYELDPVMGKALFWEKKLN